MVDELWKDFNTAAIFCTNVVHQMVCSTEQSAKSYLEAVWIKAGTFKKYWADDWMSHMSITGYFVTK